MLQWMHYNLLFSGRILQSYKILHTFNVWAYTGSFSTHYYGNFWTYSGSIVQSHTLWYFIELCIDITVYIDVVAWNRMTARPEDPCWGKVESKWCKHMTSQTTAKQPASWSSSKRKTFWIVMKIWFDPILRKIKQATS